MRDPQNIADIVKAGADMLGFIFFEKSKRYVGEFDIPELEGMKTLTERVGVFVNAQRSFVIEKVFEHQLDYVQLHGDETAQYCETLKKENPRLKTIKVFSVGEHFDFKKTEKYKEVADLFLFDTKGKERGGNGFKFNWEILQEYRGENPFLLSGGISLADVGAVKNFQHPLLWGVDVNSGFESEPGLKKSNEVEQFITSIKSN